MSPSAGYFPVAVAVGGAKVVVVGGDAEAARKAEELASFGAHVTVVARRGTPPLERLAEHGMVSWLRRSFAPGDLDGARLAYVTEAAAAPAVRAAAEPRGVLVNVLDRPSCSDFISTAICRRGDVVVAVHSSGRSAALSRRLREHLEHELAPSLAELAALLGRWRPRVAEAIASAEERRIFWLALVDRALLTAALRGRLDLASFERRLHTELERRQTGSLAREDVR